MTTSDSTLPTARALPGVSTRSVMTGALIAILLGALEQTVLAVALPAIATQLRGFDLMAWIMAAYLVTSTVVTPIYGRLSDIYGCRATLTAAISIYLLATIGCVMSETMPQLIGFRVLQGVGGGGLIAVAQAAIADVVPLRERGRYQGYISGVWAFASMLGPISGGYLTKYLSWRAIFIVNFVVGVVALVVIRHALRALPVRPGARRGIDFAGAILLAIGLTAMLVAITRLGQGVPIGEPANVLLAAGGALVLCLFYWYEQRVVEPLIPMAMLRNRTVMISCISLFIAYLQFISMSALLPLRLQIAGGVAADVAALRLLPLMLTIPVGTFLGGWLLTATGRYKPMQVSGALIATLASFGFAFAGPQQVWLLAVTTSLLGLGIGLQIPTGIVASQNAVPVLQVGLVTSLAGFSRLLGGAVGIAVLTSVLMALLRNAIPGAAEPAAGGATSADLLHSLISSTAEVNGSALRHAADGAFRTLFMIIASLSLISPLLLLGLRENALREGPQSAAPGK